LNLDALRVCEVAVITQTKRHIHHSSLTFSARSTPLGISVPVKRNKWTRLWSGSFGIELWKGHKIHLFSKTSTPVSVPTQPPIQWAQRPHPLRVRLMPRSRKRTEINVTFLHKLKAWSMVERWTFVRGTIG
jgi:hypothetical protein